MTINKDNERTTVVLPKVDLSKLQKLAEKENVSVSHFVRKAVKKFLETLKIEVLK